MLIALLERRMWVPDDTNWGCGGAGCILVPAVSFFVMIYIAGKQGMDVPKLMREFLDAVGFR